MWNITLLIVILLPKLGCMYMWMLNCSLHHLLYFNDQSICILMCILLGAECDEVFEIVLIFHLT